MKRCAKMVVLFTLIFCLVLGTCSFPASALTLAGAKGHMLSTWSRYMLTKEFQFGAHLWAYSYIEKFLDSREWQDLSAARSVCISAAEFLKDVEREAEALTDLSEEDYRVLNQAEVDNSYIRDTVRNCTLEAENLRQQLEDGYRVRLETLGRMAESDLQATRDLIELYRRVIEIESKILYNTTNYLLLSLDAPSVAEEFWNELPELYPTISQYSIPWLNSEEALYDRISALTEELGAIEEDQARIHARQEAARLKSDDTREVLVQNLPQLLPAPDWYDPSRALIYNFYEKDDGSYDKLDYQSAPPQKPVSVMIQMGNGEERAYNAYLEELKGQGFQPFPVNGEWVLSLPAYMVIMEYDKGYVCVRFLDEDITFAPLWLIEAASK